MPKLRKLSISRLIVIGLLCFSFYFATYIGSASNLTISTIFAQSNPEKINNTSSSEPNVSAVNPNLTDAEKSSLSKDKSTDVPNPASKDNATDGVKPSLKENPKDSAKKTTSPDTNPLGMNNLVPFPSNVPLPLKVGVALFVNSISKINEAANTFESQFDLRYDWTDPRLAFDTGEMGTNRLEFGQEVAIAKLATIWNPQIKITNIIEKDAQIVLPLRLN